MATSSTAEIRSWARSQGLPVADRGRLGPAILAAYAAAGKPRVKAASATPTKAAGKKASVKATTIKSASATTQRPAQKTPVSEPPEQVAASPEPSNPVPAHGKLAAVERAIDALTARVAVLESRGEGKKRFARKG